MPHTTLDHWLQNLGCDWGVDLRLNAEGMCTLWVNQSQVVIVSVDVERWSACLHAPLMVIAPEDTATLRRALELNLDAARMAGSFIGFDPLGCQLIFCYEHPMNGCDAQVFGNVIQNYLQLIEEIKEELGNTYG